MNKTTRTAVAAALMLGLTAPAFAQNQPQQQQKQPNRQQQPDAAGKSATDPAQKQSQRQRQNQAQQRQPQQQQQQQAAARSGQLKVERANELLSYDVYNMQGHKLGAIEDIVLDARSAEVAYIVLEHDDPIFDKHYAVPLGLVKLGRLDGKRVAVMDVPAAAMAEAPAFDESDTERWPERADPYFARFLQGRERADYREVTQEQPADRARFAFDDDDDNALNINRWFSFHDRMDSRRLSQVIGMDVENVGGTDLGEIEDLAIDMRSGRVAYALISFGGALNVGDQMAAVPWTAMKPRLDDDEFVLDTTREQLNNLRIEGNEDLASVEFGRRLHEQFDLQPFWVGTYGFAGDEAEQGGAWSAQSRFNKQYDPQKTRTIQGELLSVGSFRPAAGADEGIRLRIRTSDGIATVYAGPTWFARERNFDLDRGDDVTVVGSEATVDNRQVILAQTLRVDGQTLQLRDEQGKPQWQDRQRDQQRQQQLRGDDERQREMQRYDRDQRNPRDQQQWFEEDRRDLRQPSDPQFRSGSERQRTPRTDERLYDDRYEFNRQGGDVYDRFDDRPLSDQRQQRDRMQRSDPTRMQADEGRQWQTYGSEQRYEDRSQQSDRYRQDQRR